MHAQVAFSSFWSNIHVAPEVSLPHTDVFWQSSTISHKGPFVPVIHLQDFLSSLSSHVPPFLQSFDELHGSEILKKWNKQIINKKKMSSKSLLLIKYSYK